MLHYEQLNYSKVAIHEAFGLGGKYWLKQGEENLL